MNVTPSDVRCGDYLIVANPHRPRFAIQVDRIGESITPAGVERRYLVGRTFSIATFERDGMVAFNGRTKVASLRPTTTLVRVGP
jgi:hypothetical protein